MTKAMTRANERRVKLSQYSDTELFNELYDRDTIAVVQISADELCLNDRARFLRECTAIQRDMEDLCWPLLGDFGFTLSGACGCVPVCPE